MNRLRDSGQTRKRERGGAEAPAGKDFDQYDGSFSWYLALAPAIWLSITALLMLFALVAVRYLKDGDPGTWLKEVETALVANPDRAAWRAATAYSGVTFAITMVLSVAIAFWAGVAFHGKSPYYRRRTLAGVVGLFTFVFLVDLVQDRQPFTSSLGNLLLYPGCPKTFSLLDPCVPTMMLALACAVPAILTAGACFLLQPIAKPIDALVAKVQLKVLAARLRQLDQMLYVGALALVFGTLQLSAGMAASLASVPKINDVKIQTELCKTFATSNNLDPFFASSGASAPTGEKAAILQGCRQLPLELSRYQVTDSLRQLSRGVTLSFGLAFSALLVALYVPALIGLRLMIEPRQSAISGAAATETGEAASAIGEFDPLRRIAAATATLSPLIAGLLANTFAGG